MKTKRFFAAVSLVITASLMGCSGPKVHTEKAPNADIAKYQRFSWAPAGLQEQPKGLSSRPDSILDQKIKTTVNQELTKKGFAVDPKNPDVRIAYSVRTHDRIRVEPGSYGPYGGPMSEAGVSGYDNTYVQKEGSLVLDFIDAKTGKLLWRGVAVTDVKDTGITQKEVQKAIAKIMEKFPSKFAATA